MKYSEARILVYLSQVHNPDKFVRKISTKLRMDYGYLGRLLYEMMNKKWLKKHRLENKVFYDLRANAPLKEAKKMLEA